MSSNEIKIAVLEEKIDGVSKGITEIKKALGEHVKSDNNYHESINTKFDEFDKKINNKFDTLDINFEKRFAPRWTTMAVKGLYGLTGSIIVGIVIFLLTR